LKASDIRALNDGELRKKLLEAREELFNLRFRHATRQLINHRELPVAKRKIARLETILRERDINIEDD
jgi:large subunit ribosomal protein L29